MNNKRKHFQMACLASVAVLLGACSSTPDVKTDETSAAQASVKQYPAEKIAMVPVTQKPVKVAKAPAITVAAPIAAAPVISKKAVKRAVVKRKVAQRAVTKPKTTKRVIAKRKVVQRVAAKRTPVATPKARYIPPKPVAPSARYVPPKPAAPKARYVPPKPIVVAVHKARKPAVKAVKQYKVQQVVKPRARVAPKRYQQPVVRPAVVAKPPSRRLSLPRATAAVVAGAPVIRPATVPRSANNSTYNAAKVAAERARLQRTQEQQLRAEKAREQRAREKWQKDQKALAYHTKWEKNQQLLARQQQERAQQQVWEQQQALAKQQQNARAQQLQAAAQRQVWEQQQAKAKQQAARSQQLAAQQQARAQQQRLQMARQQQARVQQASYQPRVNNAAVRRPVNNYSQARLTGDFAGNPRAEAFVRMMASRHGFTQSYVAGVLSRAEATPWLRKQAYKDANPIKRKTKSKGPSWSNYRRRFITSRHIDSGTAFYNRHRRSLQRAEAQYGVPSEYILGIMGVETIYGGNVGTDRAIDALATMGFMNARRGNYFTSELESYFLMTRRARLDPLQPKASWAGALGLPQFMPSNIKKYGVDYDGDGAVNLWTPQDAIGSIANYLRSHGWKPGEIAAIPAVKNGAKGYSRLKNGFKYKHSLATLARNGLRPSYPGVSGMVNMVKLRTNRGNEYWVGGNNFYVITRYNHSSHYAMAVHQLAQEIRKRVKPGRGTLPRVIEASADRDLLMQAANSLL